MFVVIGLSLSAGLLMLPLGIIYFAIAITGISVAGALVVAPFLAIAQHLGWIINDGTPIEVHPAFLSSPVGSLFAVAFGVLIFTALMHAARGTELVKVAPARALLVKP